MKTQYLGQNCFLFTHENINILSDPFYNMGKEQSNFEIKAQKIDFILITHAHGDHIADVKEVLENHPDATIIGQPEICGFFNAENAEDLNMGGTLNIGTLKITMVQASHTSSFPNGNYGGVPAGYMLKTDETHIYLAGDTALQSDMRDFPQWYGAIDVAILPIGGHYTMDAADAALAAEKLLKTKKVIGCHFDTFEKIKIDHAAAKENFKKADVTLILPQLGEVISL